MRSPYADGWFRTGDLAELEDGYVRITGRISELVNVGGFNVSPAEVETVLLGHPQVSAAAVVGVGDAATGETLQAFVVPRPGAELDRADLLRFARARIAGYKLPYAIHVVAGAAAAAVGQARPAGAEGSVKPFALLARSPLFTGLSPAELDELGPRLQPRSLEPGQELCRAGEPGDSLFVIEAGLAHVLVDDRVVAKLRRGDVVGEMSLLTGEPRSATVVASVPTEVLELRQRDFAEAIGRSPVLLKNLNRILSQKLAATTVAGRRRANARRGGGARSPGAAIDVERDRRGDARGEGRLRRLARRLLERQRARPARRPPRRARDGARHR